MHTTHLDPLPSESPPYIIGKENSHKHYVERRFATFKLFYLEHTPPEYEPPYFKPGDPEKDRFVFTTHAKSEVPEKFSIGTVVTPHHGFESFFLFPRLKFKFSFQSRRSCPISSKVYS